MFGRTLAAVGNSVRIRGVPAWVTRSRLVVSATEDFLLWLFEATGSPEVLGSRVALAWIGGIDDLMTPMSQRLAEPTQQRAITEFMLAEAIWKTEPYPDMAWFHAHGVPGGEEPSRRFWETHAGWASTRSYAMGIAAAVGWAMGVIDDPAHMTPVMWEDGSEMSDEDRQACAEVLWSLSTNPIRPAPRPGLSKRRPDGAPGSWLA